VEGLTDSEKREPNDRKLVFTLDLVEGERRTAGRLEGKKVRAGGKRSILKRQKKKSSKKTESRDGH